MTSRLLALAASSFLATLTPAQNMGGHERTAGATGRRQHPAVKSRVVPFPFLAKSLTFTPLFPNKTNFIEMGAFVADLTSAVAPGIKQPVAATQLVYGYKKGGIGCVYEMPKQAGLDAMATFQAAIKSGTFKERQYFKEWTIKAIPDKKLLLAVSGTTPEVQAALIKALGK